MEVRKCGLLEDGGSCKVFIYVNLGTWETTSTSLNTRAGSPGEMQRFGGCHRRAGTPMSNRGTQQRLYMVHRGGSDRHNSVLHNHSQLLVHFPCDVFDSGLHDVG